MQDHGVTRLVFSSSATVYGQPGDPAHHRGLPRSPHTSPYGTTKLMGEDLLRELERAAPPWKVAYLRYFNPVGAHPSGRIGEDPRGIPNNLMPYVTQVAVGKRPFLQVFGGDYATPDGTGVRDYIHVMDLADGHVAAVRHLLDRNASVTVNLGTGRGYSVLDVIKAFEQASGRPIAHQIVARRPGDVAECYADPSRAKAELGWTAARGLPGDCADSWRWQATTAGIRLTAIRPRNVPGHLAPHADAVLDLAPERLVEVGDPCIAADDLQVDLRAAPLRQRPLGTADQRGADAARAEHGRHRHGVQPTAVTVIATQRVVPITLAVHERHEKEAVVHGHLLASMLEAGSLPAVLRPGRRRSRG